MSLVPPFVLVDRYEVTDEIGRGGHAVVYRARDRVLDRDVAIKLLRDDAISSDTLARFRQEVQVTARLEHAHILHVYDTGAFEGRPYIVMELASGRTLAERLEREGQLPVSDAIQIARDVGYALAHAHARGIVHRDVKPENILLGTGGAILADFGIARVTQELLTNKITSTGTAVGTVQYMSPEQLCAEPSIDGRSDQYALACVLYEMLAGVRPHIAATFEGLRLLRMTGRHVPVSAHRPSVPVAVDVALGRALSPMPADRYRNVEEMLVAMGVGASGEFAVSGGWGAVGESGGGPVVSGAVGAVAGGESVATKEPPRTRRWLVPAMVASVAIAAALWFVRGRGMAGASLPTDGSVAVSIADIASASGVSATVRDGMRNALTQELAAWTGVRVVARAETRDTMAVALTPTVVGLSDSMQIRLAVQRAGWTPSEVSALVSKAEAQSPGAVAKSLVREALVRAADSSMTSAEAPGVERLPTRSLVSLRAYVRGFVALRAGLLDSASARFREAAVASGSGGFAQAEFWAAQSGAWSKPNDAASWRPMVESAVRSGTLRGVDSMLAVGLQAMSRAEFPAACETYRAATSRDRSSFVAWYGLGSCQRIDTTVVKRGVTWQFRSSHWSALTAYSEAVQHAPTSAWLSALFTPILRTTYAEGSGARHGRSDALPVDSFSAMPSLEADTIAFLPIPRTQFLGDSAPPVTWVPAIRRGRAAALEITRRWIDRWPHSPEAWMQRSVALELSGMLAAADNEESALAALDRAASGASGTTLRAEIAVARARIALRRGDFASAGRIGRSAMNASWSTVERATIAPLAALVGDVRRAESMSIPDLEADPSLPAQLSDSLAAFRIRATIGACDGLEENRRRLDDAFRMQFSPSELESQRQRRLLQIYRDAVPCLGPAAIRGFQPTIPLDRAFQAIDRKDLAIARRILGQLRSGRRGATMAAITWDYTFAEAWASTAAGDTAAAIDQLRTALADLSSMSLFTLAQSPQASGLRRGIALNAALLASVNDPHARVWQAIGDSLSNFPTSRSR